MCRIGAMALLAALTVSSPDLRAWSGAAMVVLWALPGARGRGLVAGVAALAAACAVFADARHRAGLLHPALEGVTVGAMVRVESPPTVSEGRVAFIATSSDPTLPRRLRVHWYDADRIPLAGEDWWLRMRLRPVVGRRNPHGPDPASRARFEGVGGFAEVIAAPGANRLTQPSAGLLDRLRRRMQARIQGLLPDDPARAVLVALATGDRGGLEHDTRRVFVVTGTAHLMAISGLHVGLVAALGYWAGARLPRPRRMIARDRGLLVGLSASLLYSLISGFAVPARRAWTVLLLGAIAFACRRRVDPLQTLSIAAVVVVVTAPASVLAPAFSLSFAAVFALALQHRVWRARRPGQGHSGWWSIVRAQLLLSASLLPLTAAWFGEVSVIGAAVNLAMVPLFSLCIVPGVLCAAALLALGVPAGWALSAVHAVTQASLSFLGTAAAWPGATITPAALPSAYSLILFAAALVAVLGSGWPGRWLALTVFVVPLSWRPPPAPPACVSVTSLDVGQGTAIVISTRRSHYLYDTGPSYFRGGSAADRIVLPHLRALGIGALDGVIVSHGDADHAGGLAVVAAEFPTAPVLTGAGVRIGDRPGTLRCRRGQRWQADGVVFDVLWPPDGPMLGHSENDLSCVLRIRAGAFDLLITGDIEAAAEAALVASGVPAVDVVTMPHHGSRTSSTAPFVRRLDAREVLVSSAPGNRWGFPKTDVVARWSVNGARVWNTAEHGAVTARLCAASGVTIAPTVATGASVAPR